MACGIVGQSDHRVNGVVTVTGITFEAPTVVLTVGTFLGGRIHVGLDNYQGGRAGDPPSNRLAALTRPVLCEMDSINSQGLRHQRGA